MTQPANTSILFIAGDLSGDQNMAKVAQLLAGRHPDWSLIALGGPHLGAVAEKSPGGLWFADTSDLSGIGIYSSIRMYPRGRLLSMRLHRFVRGRKIDAAILCDWGTFNCTQLEFLKKIGVPVLYYFPPGSWRRSGKGGLGIAQFADRIATPFEWSAQRLNEAGGKAEWVGHPLVEKKFPGGSRAALRAEFGVGENEKLVALLPGSRMSEINCLAPRLAETAAILRGRGGTHFVAAVSRRRLEAVKRHFPDWVKIVPERSPDVLFACDAAIVKSGTATLEAAVIGAPQVMVYDFPWVGRIEWIFLWMWKSTIRFIAMPNVILQRKAIPELIGLECKPEKIAQAVADLLDDESQRVTMASAYAEVRAQLGASLPKSATLRTVEMLEEILPESK